MDLWLGFWGEMESRERDGLHDMGRAQGGELSLITTSWTLTDGSKRTAPQSHSTSSAPFRAHHEQRYTIADDLGFEAPSLEEKT